MASPNYAYFMLTSETEEDFCVIQSVLKTLDLNGWTMQEERICDKRSLSFESADAEYRDVIDFAKALAEKADAIRADQRRLPCTFVVEGYLEFTNCGEQFGYRIEKKGGKLFVRETENYTFFGSMFFEDYEEFLEIAEQCRCRNAEELCPEDEFDPDCEYCIADDGIYADEFPEYSESWEMRISDAVPDL